MEDVLALFIGCLLDNIMSVINALSECGHVVCVCDKHVIRNTQSSVIVANVLLCHTRSHNTLNKVTQHAIIIDLF